MSVSLSDVLAGAEAQAVPLSAECAGYLVLAAADQAAASPRRVQAGHVCLLDDGAVRLLAGAPADDATAEGDLRELLGGLLSSASSSTAGLLRARRRAPGAGVGALLRELERALIPVNRAAARRALARLARETVRAKDEGRLTLAPAASAAPSVSSFDAVSRASAPEIAVVPPVMVVASVAPSAPVPSVAAPVPPETEAVHTQLLSRVEVTERLELPVVSAPPRAAALPEEGETRPEPVVLRASQRPPAMPEAPSAVVLERSGPAVADPGPVFTPVYGTVLSPAILADEPRLSVEELALALATPEPAATGDEPDLEIEVTFSEDERTVTPGDAELMQLAEQGGELERTEPCPSPLAESLPPPAVAVVELPDDLLASAPFASTPDEEADAGTVLPPWVTSPAEAHELSPLPHVAVPRPRESSVDDLLERLQSDAVAVDDLRTGLKSLAGLEPTPPPPESADD